MDLQLPEGADLEFTIHGRNDELLASIPASAMVDGASYWSTTIPGTYALVEVRNRKALEGVLRMRLGEIGTEVRGARKLSVQNPADPKDEPIRMFAGKPSVILAARAVAKLAFVKANRMLTCTGFLLSNDLMLTNQHCFDTQEACSSAIVTFGYEEDADLNVVKGEEQRCQQVVMSDAGLDFSLIRVTGDPGTRWGMLQWEEKPPPAAAPLYVIQHPNGRPKRVALKGCKVKAAKTQGGVPGQKTDLSHLCDTEEGSSGSPVLNMNNRVVALHHLGFDDPGSQWARENRAALASFIRSCIAGSTQ